MDEARRVLERLLRIDALERQLLAEIVALAPETEAWARAECDPRAEAAVARLNARIAPLNARIAPP